MSASPTPETTAEVLGHIRASRAKLERLLTELDEAALTRPSPDGGWSVKDHLAHLTAWRRMVLGYLDGKPQAVGLGLDPAIPANGTEEDINAALDAKHKDLPLAQVIAEFRQVYDALIARLETFSEADWHAPYPLTNHRRRTRGRATLRAIRSSTTRSTCPGLRPCWRARRGEF